jgi:hypothetical protein
MRRSGTPPKYPGVIKLGSKTFGIRGMIRDPRTDLAQEVDRVVEDVSVQEAVHLRAEMLEALRSSAEPASGRLKVGEYAQGCSRGLLDPAE